LRGGLIGSEKQNVEGQRRELTPGFPVPTWNSAEASAKKAPIGKKPTGVSVNNSGQQFDRPAWAEEDVPGIQSSIGDSNQVARRVFVTYEAGAKRDMLANFEVADQQERDDVAGKSPNFANASAGKAKAVDIKFDFDDMDTLVVEASQGKLKWIMNNLPAKIVSVSDDLPRYPLGHVASFEDADDASVPASGAGRNLQTSFSNQIINGQMRPYGVSMVQAPEVWSQKGATGQGVKVCVIDSGIDASNPDFVTSRLSGVDDGSIEWDVDDCSHGTHCAGTIGAKNDNDGVVGVAYDVELFIVRVFQSNSSSNECGWSYSSSLMNAATQCKNNGARIISMSLSGGGPSTTERDHFQSLLENDGILSIAAAGNGGSSRLYYPASYPSIMSVAAVDSTMTKAPFSQFNDAVDIAAPGVGTYSVLSGGTGNEWSSKSGTSMATPHVAGVAALLLSAFDNANDKFGAVSAIRAAMESSALDRGTAGYDTSYGFGVVQALDAYNCLETGDCESGTVPPTPGPTCLDAPIGWHDNDGAAFNCAWYAKGVNCNAYGNSYANCDGPGGEEWTLGNGSCPTANIACCACGGGQSTIDDDTDAPTSSPVASETTGSPTSSPVTSPPTDYPTSSPVASETTGSPTSSPVTSPPTGYPTSSPVISPPTVVVDPLWELIEFEGFESGWGNWNGGGSDARHHRADAQFCATGVRCIRLRSNTSTSKMTHAAINATPYAALRIEFSFYVRSFEQNEDFFLEVMDPNATGGAWQILKDWKRSAVGVANEKFYTDAVVLDSTAFGAGFEIRFRADASGNGDLVYIDDISISGAKATVSA
jgi:subtilisin family serine protease